MPLSVNNYNLKLIWESYNNWLRKKLWYKDISETDLIKRITWFNLVVISFAIVSGLTLLGLYLNLKGIYIFGLVLLLNLAAANIIFLLLKRNTDRIAFIGQNILLIATFIIIIYLGGIPYSGGLILNGITAILSIIILRNIKWVIWLTVEFVIMIIILALFQPYLTIPHEWNMRYNTLFFALNTLWMTVYCTVLVIKYIKYRTRLEEQENLRLKELDEVKTRLYTNITHEFRTPLTVILGMVDQVEKHPEEWSKKGLEKIRKNSKTLLNLVNQMLDLSKMEAGAMKVHYIQDNIILYLNILVESFHAIAAQKNIDLNFKSPMNQLRMDYDPEKILAIISNLLSNALKYSPPGGKVFLEALTNKEANKLIITVKDNGIGIPEEKLPYIFDRFYQIDENSLHHSAGSGLGLSLTKELVKLLDGEISAKSKLNEGTQVDLSLPIANESPLRDAFDNSEITEGVLPFVSIPFETSEKNHNHAEFDNELPVLLIVEDNTDVIDYLKALLNNDYHIETALNGKRGVQQALAVVPDIIISDVMMPVMDGFEMLKTIKMDFRTSHIPIILLTAKVDTPSKLEGLEIGADAYIAKPFNKDELFIRIKSLIQLRKKLQDRYGTRYQPKPSIDKTLQIEDAFMKRVLYVLEKNISNESFGVSHLCYALSMSRTQLYRKFKALSNKTVLAYFRSMRLQKAKELLCAQNLNVTQVAFEVGFKDLSHFSYSFKQEYGISPSEIIK